MLIVLTSIIVVPTNSLASENIKAGQVNIKSGKLNIRKSANTSSKVLKKIKKGKYITLVSKEGNWWKVTYNKTTPVSFCSRGFHFYYL